MADKKISALTELVSADIATDDELVIVDTSAGETKKTPSSSFASRQTTTNMMSKGTVFWFDETDDTIIAPDVAAHDVGTGDFFLQAKFNKTNVSAANAFLINKESGGIGYGLEVREDDLWIRLDDNTADASAIIGTAVFSALTEYDVLVTFDRDGLATAYVNGVSVGTVDISGSQLTLDNSGDFTIGSETGGTTKPWGGSIGLARMGKAIPTTVQRNELISGNVPKSMQWSVVTANFVGNSISDTVWYDTTLNSDGAVTGAVVLNKPSVTPLLAFHSVVFRIEPGATPNTNIDITVLASTSRGWNIPSITDATDLAKSGTSGSFSLAADGLAITLDITEDVVGALPAAIRAHDINGSSTTEMYTVEGYYTSTGLFAMQIFKRGSSSPVDWTTVIDAGDVCDISTAFITST